MVAGEPAPDRAAPDRLVAAAELPDGTPVVLKINKPEPETAQEGDALRFWDGVAAARLLDEDAAHGALLLERCFPGDPLRTLPEPEALAVGATILRALRRPAPARHHFRLLNAEALRWAGQIRAAWIRLGQPYPRRLLDFALAQITELTAEATEAVVLHQDLHAENVLRAQHQPWLAIDPKPLVGDPAFDPASLLRDRRHELARDPDPSGTIRRRLDTLVDLLALDRERVRGWGVVHALAWALGDGEADRRLRACAALLAEAGSRAVNTD